MTRALLFVAIALPLGAQDTAVARGERVFQNSCAVAYCHGLNGTAGRAPQLQGHSFTSQALTTIVSSGIPTKGMPAFGSQLPPADLNAVVSYVMSLRGSAPARPNPVRSAASNAPPGKDLFFDAVRMGGCGRCHELERRGSAVATNLATAPPPADLRAIEIRKVMTAQPTGESAFPAWVVDQGAKRVRLYDLSSRLPVLRTFAPDQVKLTPGTTWTHASAITDYADSELQEIGKYLQSVSTAK
jgi:mono/diheme cytochrome c family protein